MTRHDITESVEQMRVRFASGDSPCAAWHYPGTNGACVVVANATSTPADRFIWDSGDPGDDPHRAYRDSVAEFTAAFSTPCLDDQPVEVREFGVLAATALALAAPWPNTPDSRGPGAEFDTQVVVPADAGGFRQLLMPPGRSPKWTPPC